MNMENLLSDKEREHVHEVYDAIASHFSSTRYKPWPVVERFLARLSPGSCGLDVGCGNGKNLKVNRDVYIIASDRSEKLVSIAYENGRNEVFIADALQLPHPARRFDFALCIAVIHHFTTADRRIAAIKSILQTLVPRGRALFFVWALEQSDSRRGWDIDSNQDVLVPWIKRQKCEGKASSQETLLRYYHLFRKNELDDAIRAAGGCVFEAGYDRDNWWAIAGNA